jgi:hypothetical protein
LGFQEETKTELELKKFEFELESYDELSISLKDKHLKYEEGQTINIKFSKTFANDETLSEYLLENFQIGANIVINHPTTQTMLSGVLARKNLRKKKFPTNSVSKDPTQGAECTLYIILKLNLYHVMMQFKKIENSPYEKIIYGWVYDTNRSMRNYNKMRGNIYTMVTDSKYQYLTDLICQLKPPKFTVLPVETLQVDP